MCKSCPTVLNLSFFKEKTLLALENDTDYKEGNIHQALLNIAYSEWQKPENDDWNYGEFIQFVIKEYGEIVAFAILIGKYNQQVCNGGHYQYYDNGYASGDGGCMNKHEGTEMHDLLLSYYLRDEKLQNISWYTDLKNILEEFLKFRIDNEQYNTESCSECYGSGNIEEEDDDGNIEDVRCSSCGGSGEEETSNDDYGYPIGHNWNELDERYYKINEQVEKDLNLYFKLKLS